MEKHTICVPVFMEVRPNGEAYNMRTGITTLGYRNHSDTRQIYEPGEKVQITIDMWDLAWKIQKGSRIRIDLTSSDLLGYRNHSDTRQIYEPGEKVQITIDMWDLAWKIQKGSRIRIDLTSSDFPQYSVHSNFAGCWATQKKVRSANQQVYYGGYAESYISLPLL